MSTDQDVQVPMAMTPSELRITRNALHAFLSDFGHDEEDVIDVIRAALEKVDAAMRTPAAPVTTG